MKSESVNPAASVSIRPMTCEDVPAVAAMMEATIRRDPGYISHGELQMGIAEAPGRLSPDACRIIAEELTERIKLGDPAMLVAELDGRLAGFVSAREESQYSARYGIIADLGVDPEIRGHGVGSLLVEQAVGILKSLGVTRVFLESGVANEHAHSFFARHGFKVVSKVFACELTD